MGHFDKGSKFDGGGFSAERTTLHKAVCSDCGKGCEVPFKPLPGKPVFCRDCFKKDGESSFKKPEGKSFNKFGKKDFGRSDYEEKPKFDATCSDCGKQCQVPFRPNGEKPVLCSECFSVAKGDNFAPKGHDKFAKKNESFESRKPDRTSEQLEKMNAKLERMLKLLEALGTKREKEPVKEVVKKEAAKEVIKEAVKEIMKGALKKEVVAEKPSKAAKAAKAKKTKKAE